jgi:DNA-binding NarL/FixJ family response regulator
MENNNKRKILLIDDDEMMRIFFRDIFWIHGKDDTYDISMASSLEEAEKIIENPTTMPDIVFLDLFISSTIKGHSASVYQVARSLEFISRIKSNKKLSGIKIIIYSGQKDKSTEEAVLKLGASGYLIKGELLPKEIISYVDKINGTNN